MSLKRRKIMKVLAAHSEECAASLNEKLGTEFKYDFNWECAPEDIADWNWEHDRLKVLLYNSYYRPIEEGLKELMEDEDYKEAILEQISTFNVVPGRQMVADFEYSGDGVFAIKHTLCVNHGNESGGLDFVPSFKDAVENGLS